MSNQVIPVSSFRRDRNNVQSPLSQIPDTCVSVLSLSVRAGKQRSAIGLVQSISFSVDREVEEYFEITPYAPNDFGSLTAIFNNQSFNDSIVAEGEATTLIPGIQKPITVTVTRPMLYSSNVMEAVFKAGGAGEFTTSEMVDFRYSTASTGVGFGGRLLAGAAAGALIGLGSNNGGGGLINSVGAGAAVGAVQAGLANPDPEKVRYGTPLQQVRPVTISLLVFSPLANGTKDLVYGLEFQDGWSQKWTMDNVTADGDIVMENLEIVFPRLRVLNDFS